MKKLVGKVTVEEKNEIQLLFERRNGLTELAKILSADNAELYEKLVKDIGRQVLNFNNGGTVWLNSIIGSRVKVEIGKSISNRARFS